MSRRRETEDNTGGDEMKFGSKIAVTAVALALVAPTFATAGDAAAGKETYDKKCASCHGADGKGDEKMAGS
ncbi:MAG: c-type cytochrome [Deltaproteobacteria bacterium]|nr:c-type cytochrome [Deltaproteobacteria bacterium]